MNCKPFNHVPVPLVEATPESLQNFGELVDNYESHDIEIVTWPQPGWRKIDAGTGNEGGTTEGVFKFWWEGEVLKGENTAVSDRYTLGWCCDPEQASENAVVHERSHLYLFHANYHPDGGQLFFPKNGEAFIAPLAPPGDDVKPEDFMAFYCDGSKGLYIHPNIWHEAVFPLAESAEFYDKQGKVHARISCNFAEEFGVYLEVPLKHVNV